MSQISQEQIEFIKNMVNNAEFRKKTAGEWYGELKKQSGDKVKTEDVPKFLKELFGYIGVNQEPSAEQIEKTKKVVDPQGTGEITLENYENFLLTVAKKIAEEGKIPA